MHTQITGYLGIRAGALPVNALLASPRDQAMGTYAAISRTVAKMSNSVPQVPYCQPVTKAQGDFHDSSLLLTGLRLKTPGPPSRTHKARLNPN
jgi:hypothetical protein